MRLTTLLPRTLLLLALLPPAAQPSRAQVSADPPREVPGGALAELRDRRRVALIVQRAAR